LFRVFFYPLAGIGSGDPGPGSGPGILVRGSGPGILVRGSWAGDPGPGSGPGILVRGSGPGILGRGSWAGIGSGDLGPGILGRDRVRGSWAGIGSGDPGPGSGPGITSGPEDHKRAGGSQTGWGKNPPPTRPHARRNASQGSNPIIYTYIKTNQKFFSIKTNKNRIYIQNPVLSKPN
jgi:hypothetical protein